MAYVVEIGCSWRDRYVEASWDLNEVLAKREEIVRDNLLVTKLAGPVGSSTRA